MGNGCREGEKDDRGGAQPGLTIKDRTYWDELWKRQTLAEKVFELFWTVTPWDHETDYQALFSRASRDMEARKMVRDFRHACEPGIKCHQCGMREAPHGQLRDFWRQIADLKGTLRHRIRPTERLCAAC